jgi:lysophospholipase L1-like esterase
VFGCTLLPFKGSLIDPQFWTPDREVKRQLVNDWIRTSGAYDAVIDFDKVVRDPAQQQQMLPTYDSGDHTHPNDAGYKAMSKAINLELFHSDD